MFITDISVIYISMENDARKKSDAVSCCISQSGPYAGIPRKASINCLRQWQLMKKDLQHCAASIQGTSSQQTARQVPRLHTQCRRLPAENQKVKYCVRAIKTTDHLIDWEGVKKISPSSSSSHWWSIRTPTVGYSSHSSSSTRGTRRTAKQNTGGREIQSWATFQQVNFQI